MKNIETSKYRNSKCGILKISIIVALVVILPVSAFMMSMLKSQYSDINIASTINSMYKDLVGDTLPTGFSSAIQSSDFQKFSNETTDEYSSKLNEHFDSYSLENIGDSVLFSATIDSKLGRVENDNGISKYADVVKADLKVSLDIQTLKFTLDAYTYDNQNTLVDKYQQIVDAYIKADGTLDATFDFDGSVYGLNKMRDVAKDQINETIKDGAHIFFAKKVNGKYQIFNGSAGLNDNVSGDAYYLLNNGKNPFIAGYIL